MIPIITRALVALTDVRNRHHAALITQAGGCGQTAAGPGREACPQSRFPAATAQAGAMIPIRPSLFAIALPLLARDAGPWRGIATEAWLARFNGRSDDHAGARPIRYGGNRRRRSDRVIRPSERRAAA